jgi:hypothetical protein
VDWIDKSIELIAQRLKQYRFVRPSHLAAVNNQTSGFEDGDVMFVLVQNLQRF